MAVMTMSQAPAPMHPLLSSLTIDDVFPISVSAYEGLIRDGYITDDHKVELIYGRIIRRMTTNAPHYTVAGLLQDWLTAHRPDGWFVAVEVPIRLATSVPHPDLMLVRGARRDFLHTAITPDEAQLVIEVADTSFTADKFTKSALYAEAGIAVYWIVNINAGQIEVHSQPVSGAYQQVTVYDADEHVPFVLDGVTIALLSVGEVIP
jgi:Uma2 family endonuclease